MRCGELGARFVGAPTPTRQAAQPLDQRPLHRRIVELDVVVADDDDQLVAGGDELAEPPEHALVARDHPLQLLLRLALAEAEAVEPVLGVVGLVALPRAGSSTDMKSTMSPLTTRRHGRSSRRCSV